MTAEIPEHHSVTRVLERAQPNINCLEPAKPCAPRGHLVFSLPAVVQYNIGSHLAPAHH